MKNTKTMVGVGVLTAVVIVLQVLAGLIPINIGPFNISLVLIPIVVGAALYGWKAGAWLGFVFSVVVLINNASAFLAVNIPGTVITVLAKGTVAGIAAGFAYLGMTKLKANRYVSVIVAGLVCPVVNTGLFVVGCLLFFMPTLSGWAEALGYKNAISYMFFGMIGINFLIEVALNMILSPAIVRIISIGKKENAGE